MISSSHASNFVDFFRSNLLQTNPSDGRGLGPLISILGSDGSWAPDALARARRHLDIALEDWASEGGRHYKDVTSADVARVLRDYWGLAHFPVSLGEAGRRMTTWHEASNRTKGASDQTVANWNRAVLESSAFKAALARELPAEPTSKPTGHLPTWSPHPETWPEDVGGERQRLLRRARELAGPTVALSAGDWVQVLRELVADSVYENYLTGTETMRRTMNNVVLDSWFWKDAAHEPIEAQQFAIRADVREQTLARLAAVCRMSFHDVLPQARQVVNESVVEKLRDVATQRIAVRSGARDGLRVSYRPARSEIEFRLRRDALPEQPPRVPIEELLVGATITDLLESRASEIRATGNRDAALAMSDTYLHLRRSVDWDSVRPYDLIRIELADHTAQLGFLDRQLDHHLYELRDLIATAPASATGVAYKWLPARIEALLEARHQKFRLAALRCEAALGELDQRWSHGRMEHKAYLESSQQIALAGAGITVRMLERSIATARDESVSPTIRSWAPRCVSQIQRALANLALLDGPTFGLAQAARHDLHLSSIAWRTWTPVVSLRIKIALHIASGAGLLGASQLWIPSVSELRDDYRLLAAMPELDGRDSLNLVRLALWIALLGDGTIPAVRDLAPALRAHFLDVVSPADTSSWESSRIPIDFPAIASLLESQGHDDGLLGKLRPGGITEGHLERRNPGALREWRTAVAQVSRS